MQPTNKKEKYIDENGRLDVGRTMLKFQEFMKEHYSDKDSKFLEREGRLIFMSFLKPIINGYGFMWKESVVGDERKADVACIVGVSVRDVLRSVNGQIGYLDAVGEGDVRGEETAGGLCGGCIDDHRAFVPIEGDLVCGFESG